jgi:RimJ/RimL family protein N-acetyltransferase
VIVDRVVSYLEMTSPERLVPGREPPTPLLFDPAESRAPLVRETHLRVGTPHHWSSVLWTDEQWAAQLTLPHQYNWILRVEGGVAGITSMVAEPGGDVQIMVFGLVPEWVGMGYGGAALTQAVRLAWNVPPVDAAHVRRVHLDTMSLDHPHALPNYLARGFRVYRIEQSTKTILDV